MKKYLMFVSHSYAYSILRPIQDEIRRRGGEAAWYIEDTSPVFLHDDEQQLKTIQEVLDYDPFAIFAPGNHIYDFFPGIKVEVFHGLYYKRTDYGDHYRIRGWFDLYCVTSSLFMPKFQELEQQQGSFKVVHTGWSKFDDAIPTETKQTNDKPLIIYAPTFTKELYSAVDLYPQIERLVAKKNWEWIFSFHPKMDQETIQKYKKLTEKYANVSFDETENKVPLYRKADLMLCDSSSVIYEFLWFYKPVVTYKNTFPGNHLINIDNPKNLEASIEKALQHPSQLMENIRTFMDTVHPYRDGKSSARILDAVDNFDKNYKGKLKKKPLNLIRKLKIRKKAHYFPFGPRYQKQK